MDQGRLGQPDPLVQGPGRLGGRDQPRRALGFERIACASDRATSANAVRRAARARACARDGLRARRPRASRRSSPRPSTAARSSAVRRHLRRRQPPVQRARARPTSSRRRSSTSTCGPYYAEGSKTLGFEVAEQLGWRLPDAGGDARWRPGSLLTKVDKALQRAGDALGLVPATPWRVFGAQSAGCSPIATAFDAGLDVVTAGQADRHRQVAGHRQPGRRAVRARTRCVRTGGAMAAADDDEIRAGDARSRDHRRLRRDRGRRHWWPCSEARRVWPPRSHRRRPSSQHRRRAQDPGRGFETATPTAVIEPTLAGMRTAGRTLTPPVTAVAGLCRRSRCV